MRASPQFTSWPAAALLPLAAALTCACAALAACSSAATGKDASITATPAATASGSGGLCANTQNVHGLLVRRTSRQPRNFVHFTFPARVNVNDPGQARAVAQAACQLPPMPAGGFVCPAGLGITYTLSFTLGGRKDPAVTIDATECEEVSGIGRTRWVMRTPAFWSVLGQAMGIPHAGYTTFSGSIDQGRPSQG
jgi:hypothetical protein